MCAPPARSAPSCCASWRRSAIRARGVPCAADAPCAARAPISRRSPKSSQLFSAPLDEVPADGGGAIGSRQGRRKGAAQSWSSNWPLTRAGNCTQTPRRAPDGVRRVTQRLERGNLEDLRAVAQNFTAQPKAVFWRARRSAFGAAGRLRRFRPGCRQSL